MEKLQDRLYNCLAVKTLILSCVLTKHLTVQGVLRILLLR